MSTIKSSNEHLTLNADGSSKDIKFQANGVEKASISSAGAFTSTTIDATKLTGDLPAISGANLTGVGVSGITSTADSTAITIDSAEQVSISNSNNGNNTVHIKALNAAGDEANLRLSGNISGAGMGAGEVAGSLQYFNNTDHIASISGMRDGGNEGQLSFKTRGGSDAAPVEQLKITKEGYVTMPNQPAFLVNARQSASNIAVNANTTAQFTEEVYDVNADYNTSTYTFTAPVTGKYQFNVSLLWMNWDASANYYYLKLVTSNRTYYELFNGGERSSDVTYAYGHIHVLADMDANDTAYVELFQNSGAQQTYYENQSVFGGYLAC